MSRKKQEAVKDPKDTKPFDGLLKALFAEQSEEIISCLMHGTRRSEGVANDQTTTILQQDKQKIREVLQMQYPGYALFREDPVIHGMILEGERKGEIKGKIEGELEGLRKAILDIADDLFSPSVVAQVQQAITPSHNIEKLRKFHRKLVRLLDEQEVLALLTECFPLPGEVKGLQDAILDVADARFSPQIVAQVQQAIAPNEDVQQLRKFLRQVVQLSDEQEVSALLTQFFPNSQEDQ